MRTIPNGSQVTYQYRQHHLLGGALIAGAGVVVDRTIVGTSDAYIIKPNDGGECVHVRAIGVTVVVEANEQQRINEYLAEMAEADADIDAFADA